MVVAVEQVGATSRGLQCKSSLLLGGVSHRSLFNKSSRILHLFSDLEFIYSCLFDWSPCVTDCRERYPLLRDDVQSISEELSIPVISYEGVQQVRFSDFLVDDAAHPLGQYAVDIRYLNDLKSNGAIEALELQRRYWEMKNIGRNSFGAFKRMLRKPSMKNNSLSL